VFNLGTSLPEPAGLLAPADAIQFSVEPDLLRQGDRLRERRVAEEPDDRRHPPQPHGMAILFPAFQGRL
jgi:hypothetical protein